MSFFSGNFGTKLKQASDIICERSLLLFKAITMVNTTLPYSYVVTSIVTDTGQRIILNKTLNCGNLLI